MTLIELKEKLSEHGNIDVDGLYAKFLEDGGTDDVNDFIRFLRDRGDIDARMLAELHAVAEQKSAHPLEATFIMAGPQSAVAAPAKPAPSAADDEDDEDDEPPRYEMMGVLGKGAMGEVHIAKDVVLRRTVAFKSILPAMSQNQMVVDRFVGEMQITSQLDHPYIVPVYGLEVTPEGSIAYAMKLVKGKEFADLLAEAKSAITAGQRLDQDHTLNARLEVFLKVCDAIAFAHEKKIVHRDLKPANIMIGEHKEVYVMDWGIARPMGAGGEAADAGLELYDSDDAADDTTRTRLGQALGTPIYMSPEQAAGRNEELDGRSDLYTLGLILQEVMTLERALGGTTLAEVLTNAKQGKREPARPFERATVGAVELEAIIAKATQLEPKDRYATVTDFARDIRRYLQNEEISVLPDNAVRKAGRWVSHNRMAALSNMLVFLLVGATTAIGLLAYNRAQAAEQHTHELRLSELQTDSAIQAHAIDQKLKRYESGLARLVGATQLLLSHPQQDGRRAHLERDYATGTPPADLAPSAYYKKPISTTAGAFVFAPGTDETQVTPLLGALPTLEPTLAEVMLESANVPPQKLTAAQRQALIAGNGLPVHRVFVSLAEGVHLTFPGMSGAPKDYDPRKEVAYVGAIDTHDLRWGKPHVDAVLGGMVMTCSAPLYDELSRFRGIAGLEVSIDRLGEEISVGLGYVDWAALVARDGTVMTSTKTDEKGPSIADVLAVPAVAKAMKAGTGGHAAAVLGGQDVLVTYYPLHSVEWYYVAVANVATMLGSEPQASPATPWASAVPLPVATNTPAPPPPAPVVEPADAGAGGADAGAGGEDAGVQEPPVAPPPSGAPWPNAKPPQPPATPPPPGAPTAIPKNPFDKWDAYKKDKDGKAP